MYDTQIANYNCVIPNLKTSWLVIYEELFQFHN